MECWRGKWWSKASLRWRAHPVAVPQLWYMGQCFTYNINCNISMVQVRWQYTHSYVGLNMIYTWHDQSFSEYDCNSTLMMFQSEKKSAFGFSLVVRLSCNKELPQCWGSLRALGVARWGGCLWGESLPDGQLEAKRLHLWRDRCPNNRNTCALGRWCNVSQL
jgi:hypothetical protein